MSRCTGNHAQALSLAASTFEVPAYIVMPSISTPSKILATQALTPHVIFSGSTSEEREEKVKEVIARTGAVLIPPYDHGDVVLGQGTVGVEIEEQFKVRRDGQVCTVHAPGENDLAGVANGTMGMAGEVYFKRPTKQLDAVVVPCGGGGLLSGTATYFSVNYDGDDARSGDPCASPVSTRAPSSILADPPSAPHQVRLPPPGTGPSTLPGQQDEYQSDRAPDGVSPTLGRRTRSQSRRTPLVFGAEPCYQGADDARRSLERGFRLTSVKSLTIADGLRTPLGHINWDVISNPENVEGIFSATEEQIREAMRLLMERAKWVVEPSGAVALAVILYQEEFRSYVEAAQKEEARMDGQGGEGEIRPWDIGVVISGGNTTVDAIAGLFGPSQEGKLDESESKSKSQDDDGPFKRQQGKITTDGERVVENNAG
jgi:threonine dehydratase